MRIIVISDTHGNFNILNTIVQKHLSDGDAFIFLGDGYREFEEVKKRYPDKPFYSVRGNCDLGYDAPEIDSLTVCNHKIIFTHGHLFGVKYGLDSLIRMGKRHNGYILLYGHTHQNFTVYNNMYIFNPGSPFLPRNSKASYGILDITDAGVVCNIVELGKKNEPGKI